jgi:Mrp family chromosome partitioning ATPase
MTSGIIRPSGVEDFDIIDSGPLPGSPAEVLASARMHELIEANRDVYDYIIIDGPPMLVSDAKTLAALADGTILVLNAENTHRGAAQRTLRELSAINARLVGTVLVGVRAMKGGYFQEAFRSYQDYQKVAVAAQSVA